MKRYHSEKTQHADGTWEHSRIVLSPDTTAEGYEPILIDGASAQELQVIAEWLGPVS